MSEHASLKLKHLAIVDLFCVADGFVLRVYAGAVAIGVPLSAWMLNTTWCLALNLATIKRRQELRGLGDQARTVLKQYSVELLDHLALIAAVCAIGIGRSNVSRRDFTTQPRVARGQRGLPWVSCGEKQRQPQRGCAREGERGPSKRCHPKGGRGIRNPYRVGLVLPTYTQGSAPAAPQPWALLRDPFGVSSVR